MSEEVKEAGSSEVSEIKGYREWAAEHFPLAQGWNSGTDILLRGAWMAAVRGERERCAMLCKDERDEFLELSANYNGRASDFAFGSVNSADRLAAAIRKG